NNTSAKKSAGRGPARPEHHSGAAGNFDPRPGPRPDRRRLPSTPSPQSSGTRALPRDVASPVFRGADWLAFLVTALVMLAGYLLTLAPDLTLEDSGELAVAAQYAGVPHAPGYPLWTIYGWLFTKLLPFSNVAWRVAVSSAVAGALACGLIALLVSRGTRLLLAAYPGVGALEPPAQNAVAVT